MSIICKCSFPATSSCTLFAIINESFVFSKRRTVTDGLHQLAISGSCGGVSSHVFSSTIGQAHIRVIQFTKRLAACMVLMGRVVSGQNGLVTWWVPMMPGYFKRGNEGIWRSI